MLYKKFLWTLLIFYGFHSGMSVAIHGVDGDVGDGNDDSGSVHRGLQLVSSLHGVRSESQEKERALRLAKLDEETAASRARRAQHEAAEAMAIQAKAGTYADTAFVGQVVWSAGVSMPSGFLPCDGITVSRTTYAALFSAIGTLYGGGDGVTTFNLPDLRGRTVASFDVVDRSGTAGRLPSTYSKLGTAGGEATHILTVAEMPAHSHMTYYPAVGRFGGDTRDIYAGSPARTQESSATGGNAPHNIVQPTILLQAFICAQGTSYKHAKELHREATLREDPEDQVTCCSSFFGRWLTSKLPLFG